MRCSAAMEENEMQLYLHVWTLKDKHDKFIVFHLFIHLLIIVNIYWVPVVCQVLFWVLGHSFIKDTQFLPPWSQYSREDTTSEQVNRYPARCQRWELKKMKSRRWGMQVEEGISFHREVKERHPNMWSDLSTRGMQVIRYLPGEWMFEQRRIADAKAYGLEFWEKDRWEKSIDIRICMASMFDRGGGKS